MNQSLQDAIKEAYALAPSMDFIVHTLEIRQTGVQDPIYIAQTSTEFVAFDENGDERTFNPVGFQFSLPPSNEEGFQSLNIAIDNVGRIVSDFVAAAKSDVVPIEIRYRPYLNSDRSGPQMIPPLLLYLRSVQVTAFQVVGKATFMDIINKKYPSELYSRVRFPTLG